MHRLLIGVITCGAVIIAGIGFAGSYTAVRHLAIRQGFGTFSYLFPIGIDAGICVLLALDLLLTWTRTPLAQLRQTAWLLTAATITFNAATAWPDPLGAGMHAVIPVLFIITVEAARHAIGRIADITADQHMEGIRPTRWLLAPVPTFLLWRRMKLWEQRSYHQAIKLEQERLIYQARLHSRFGRTWRRTAPVEALIPLQLARYGIPLAHTAPAGLAAAGLEPVLLPPEPETTTAPPQRPAQPAPPHPALRQPGQHTPWHQQQPTTHEPLKPLPHEEAEQQSPLQEHLSPHTVSSTLTPATPAHTGQHQEHGAQDQHAQYGGRSPASSPPSGPAATLAPRDRRASTDSAPAPPATASTATTDRTGTPPSHPAPPTQEPIHARQHGAQQELTAPDRYYLAWMDYQTHHGRPPTGQELSAYLAAKGLYGRGNQPVSPANLRRHFLRWRIYPPPPT
ncbi:MAG: DUF2637 domain-containing protein [Catenulispora sp.]